MVTDMKSFYFVIFVSWVNFASCEKKYCNGGLGECTPFSKCTNLTVFDDGSDKLNVRFNLEDESVCHYLEMCCDPEDVLSNEEVINIKNGQNIEANPVHIDSEEQDQGRRVSFPQKSDECESNNQECISFYLCTKDHTTDGANVFSSRLSEDNKCPSNSQVCCDKKENVNNFVPTSCGTRFSNGIGYTVTNSIDEAQFAEFPWMAAISLVQDDGASKFICGGSLIDPHVVLTAAHCVHDKDASNLIVRLGEWDTQTTSEVLPHSDHEVIRIISHPQFGKLNLYNDIALLVLKDPVKMSAHINTVCLPPQNAISEGSCFATGWGADEYNDHARYRTNLKKVELPVVPLRTCQDKLRQSILGPRYRIHQSFMCAGGELNVDTCKGDGGGPLVCTVPGYEDVFYQAGIVAYGVGCGQQNVPGVYANVAKFRSWIDYKMNLLGYGTASYSIE